MFNTDNNNDHIVNTCKSNNIVDVTRNRAEGIVISRGNSNKQR
jgi:hypothetical protein